MQKEKRALWALIQQISAGLGVSTDVGAQEEVLPDPLTSVAELDGLGDKLQDKNYKRKLLTYFSAFGGRNGGDYQEARSK
ncbi:hypothetical protein HHUSO_G35913 [Huso huso]|uniref:Uncharacterized protein n=1 Tax=Huso huso TaxID=61971 RepID=A0ABR0Y1U2_HUSHU